MIREFVLVLVYLAFLVLGCVAPFIFTLGYLWVDTFRPQELSYLYLQSFPVSMIMAAAALGGYLVLDRKDPPPLRAQTVLTLLLGVWVTFTTMMAVAPDAAWPKWDWAFKTILFSAFVPFVIRTRLQIEAFIQVYVLALAVHYMSAGAKTVLGGGGYGRTLSAAGNTNSGLAEGSTLAAVSIMLIPLILYLMRHTILLPRILPTRLVYLGLIVAALAASVGTYARTGMIGLVVLAVALFLTTKRKILTGSVIAIAALGIIGFASATWESRISTIQNFQSENSALGRILVWQWTLGFVKDRPLGGGFNAFVVNEIVFPPEKEGGQPILVKSKAFHSIYFEVLGEHGYVGLALFAGLILVTLFSLWRVIRRTRGDPEMQWCHDLGKALLTGLVVLLACGAFIGIAFQPMLYYMFALGASLSTLAARSAAPRPARDGTWRAATTPREAVAATAPADRAAGRVGWRQQAGP
jgi:probable O-glycosylation ligase (exosortase A-associated)